MRVGALILFLIIKEKFRPFTTEYDVSCGLVIRFFITDGCWTRRRPILNERYNVENHLEATNLTYIYLKVAGAMGEGKYEIACVVQLYGVMRHTSLYQSLWNRDGLTYCRFFFSINLWFLYYNQYTVQVQIDATKWQPAFDYC